MPLPRLPGKVVGSRPPGRRGLPAAAPRARCAAARPARPLRPFAPGPLRRASLSAGALAPRLGGRPRGGRPSLRLARRSVFRQGGFCPAFGGFALACRSAPLRLRSFPLRPLVAALRPPAAVACGPCARPAAAPRGPFGRCAARCALRACLAGAPARGRRWGRKCCGGPAAAGFPVGRRVCGSGPGCCAAPRPWREGFGRGHTTARIPLPSFAPPLRRRAWLPPCTRGRGCAPRPLRGHGL